MNLLRDYIQIVEKLCERAALGSEDSILSQKHGMDGRSMGGGKIAYEAGTMPVSHAELHNDLQGMGYKQTSRVPGKSVYNHHNRGDITVRHDGQDSVTNATHDRRKDFVY